MIDLLEGVTGQIRPSGLPIRVKEDPATQPHIGYQYKHYADKKIYKVSGFSTLTSTGERLVNYFEVDLYCDGTPNLSRPEKEWSEIINEDGDRRYELVQYSFNVTSKEAAKIRDVLFE